MIKKIGSQYVLFNNAGTKVLGKHSSKEKAIKQEQAIKTSESSR